MNYIKFITFVIRKEIKTFIWQDAFGSPTFSIQTARKIKTAEDALSFIRQLETLDRESVKHIVLDCPAAMAREIIVKHVQTVMLGQSLLIGWHLARNIRYPANVE